MLPSKSSGRRLKAGDVIRIVGPNAGGYGSPSKRDPERVAADVLDGLISVETARDVYGVALDPLTGAIDRAGTARLRAG